MIASVVSSANYTVPSNPFLRLYFLDSIESRCLFLQEHTASCVPEASLQSLLRLQGVSDPVAEAALKMTADSEVGDAAIHR